MRTVGFQDECVECILSTAHAPLSTDGKFAKGTLRMRCRLGLQVLVLVSLGVISCIDALTLSQVQVILSQVWVEEQQKAEDFAWVRASCPELFQDAL